MGEEVTLRQQVMNLPRVQKKGLTPARAKSLCERIDVAVQRLCGVQAPKRWKKDRRPTNLLLCAYVWDVMRAMQKAGLPATYFVGHDRRGGQTTSLLIEMLDMGVREASRQLREELRVTGFKEDVERGYAIDAPRAGGWRRKITKAKKMHRMRPKRLKYI